MFATLSFPIRLIIQYALTILLLWLLTRIFPDYLMITGAWTALPILAAILLLLNMFVRPLLKAVTLPIRLVATLIAIILVNALFLWILESVLERIDPSVAMLVLSGGAVGWWVVAIALGIGNWLIHKII